MLILNVCQNIKMWLYGNGLALMCTQSGVFYPIWKYKFNNNVSNQYKQF